MKEHIDNLNEKLGCDNYGKLAELLGVSHRTIMRLKKETGVVQLRRAYVLLSLALNEVSPESLEGILKEYKSLNL